VECPRVLGLPNTIEVRARFARFARLARLVPRFAVTQEFCASHMHLELWLRRLGSLRACQKKQFEVMDDNV
jgi:hypothetical protein